MIYIENVLICISAPLLIAMLCGDKSNRPVFAFFIAGMGMCLLSAYINTFLASYYCADMVQATVEIAPVVEETMKLLPVLFYLLVFEPKQRWARSAIFYVAAGFATFENACYLVENGTSHLLFLLMRGFGAGAMHIVCGAIVGYGLLYVWRRPWLKVAGTFGLLCIAITFHAIYNLLLSVGDAVQTVGLIIPVLTVLSSIGITKLLKFKQRK
ncbi:MAG TPA: PrsW family glutamic-type intramembrane protease [Acetivibrio sp.]|jgi:RsiW-degrading membrane proteinase PrsW (M82 family)|nr:PrsW family glutamic-type intramembrane protease [Acetivibrio sp.]